EEGAGLRGREPEQQLDEGRLARAAGPDDREPATGRDGEREVVDDVAPALVVAEPQVTQVEGGAVGGTCELGGIEDRGSAIDEPEQAGPRRPRPRPPPGGRGPRPHPPPPPPPRPP